MPLPVGPRDRIPSPADALPPAPGNLPAELTRFVGRTAELTELGRRLSAARLVTVTGVGGVGKTRLATRAAAIEQERFCDGAWLVELSALREANLLEHTVLEALGLAGRAGRPPRSVLADHLAERELLLVLDGHEHLVDVCARLVGHLLRRAPGLSVLAAGRRPLGIPGEQVVPLSPLPAPDPARSERGPLIGDAAVLFAQRAAAVLPGFRITDDNLWAVAELCHRLDGVPLALELAAGRLRALSVGQILDRLDDRFQLLTSGARGALPRHRTLRTAIGWSHELCTPRERLLWARLSVFAGHFGLEAVEYICSGPDLPADEVLDLLGELVAQSVVIREDTPAGVRYRLLGAVRAYGADWLAALDEVVRLRRRHRDWYMGLATWCELDWFGPRQAEVAARIDCDLPNLRAALEFSLENPEDAHLGQYLAGTLWFYWVGCGRLSEGRHWLDRALEAEGDHDDSRLKALWVAGYVAVLQGDGTGAIAALQECLAAAERTDNALAAAYGLHCTGCLALVSDDMPRAEELIRAALARYRELGELNTTVLMAQVELAMAIAFQGDLAGAVALCEEVRDICEDHGERWTLAYALYVLGFAAQARGETAAARELLCQCLAIDHAFHDRVGAVLAIELLALITADEGDPAEAAVLQGVAGQLWRSVGLPLFGSQFFNAPHAVCERQARELLGPERYDECLCEGARLDLDTATARVVERRSEHGTAPLPGPRGTRYAGRPAAQESTAPPADGREAAGPAGDGSRPRPDQRA